MSVMLVGAAVRVAVLAVRVIVPVPMIVVVAPVPRRRQAVRSQPRYGAEHEQRERDDRDRKRRKPNRYWSHTHHIRSQEPREDPSKQEPEQYAEGSLWLRPPQAAPKEHEYRDAEQPGQHSVRPLAGEPGRQ